MLAGAGVLLLGNSVAAQGQVRERLDELASIQRVRGALSADLGQAAPRISRTEAGTLAPAFWAHDDGENAPAMQFVRAGWRSEEHTSELQSLMRISYAVFCLKKKKN